jgi:hypothetical protein
MSRFKYLAAGLLAASMAAQGAQASLQKFGVTNDESFSYNSTTGTFNITGGTLSNLFTPQNIGLNTSYTVNETLGSTIGGTNGVQVTSATTGLLGNDTADFLTLGAFDLTYTFATPTQVGNTLATTLLNVAVTNAQFIYDEDNGNAIFTFSIKGGNGVSFSSDALQFKNIANEQVAFSFSDVELTNGMNLFAGFTANGSGNFSSDPLPAVPEPLSAALLIVGMTAVGVASRRRAA